MIAARFISVPCIGSYILDTTSMNIKNIIISICPLTRSEAPTSATVPIPNLKMQEALITNTDVPNSALKLSFSRLSIFSLRLST